MVLRLWTSSSSTSICRGRNTWPCLTSSVTSLRNSFQLFTTSTSTGTLSSLICTDRTTQQLSHHTSKVDQSLQFCTVFTDRLLATSSPTLWWKALTMASLRHRAIRKSTWWILEWFQVSQHVHVRIGWNTTFLVNISWSVPPFSTMGLGDVTSKLSTIPIFKCGWPGYIRLCQGWTTTLLTGEFVDPIISYCVVFSWSGRESAIWKWQWKTGWNPL